MQIKSGALKSKKDRRDYKYDKVAMSTIPFDWNQGFDIEEFLGIKLPVKDQDGSGSCGGQAFGYYGQVLDNDKDEKSAKFIYAQTFIPPAGTYGRDLCNLVKNKGWGTEKLTISYENGRPPTEQFMQRKQDITAEAFAQALTDTALSYVSVPLNIDIFAQAIRDNNGMIIGIRGENNGSWRTAYPIPPTNYEWQHWIYAGKAKMINGKKYIGFLNSWGEFVGEKGWQYISEDYVKSKYIFETWTLVYNYPKFKFKKDMKFGMRCECVKELQKRLGMPVYLQTGFFGTITRGYVKRYQLSHNLVDDGVVGRLTRAVLNV